VCVCVFVYAYVHVCKAECSSLKSVSICVFTCLWVWVCVGEECMYVVVVTYFCFMKMPILSILFLLSYYFLSLLSFSI